MINNLRLFFIVFMAGLFSVQAVQTLDADISRNLQYVNIYQDGKKAVPADDTVTIERRSFEIRFSYKDPISLLVNASSTPESFDLFYEEPNIGKVPGFSGTGFAEGMNNDALSIILSTDSPNAWFYEDESRNRFDKNKAGLLRILSTRTIENIVRQRTQSMPIEQSGLEELYLCIAEYKYIDGKRHIYGRKRIKIVFRD